MNLPLSRHAVAVVRAQDVALFALWLLLLVVALGTRPLLPVDETRYLSVAWEMWRQGSFLVPLLNGEPYSHKPPLLFWLVDAGWWLFGVQEWWGRVVAPLFGLASLFAAGSLARALWPAAPGRAKLVPWLLLGCLSWAMFTTVTMFDMMMVLLTIVALLGLVRVWRARDRRAAMIGWSLVAAGLGLGALAKGPIILLYVLPAALLAPVWMRPEPPRWPRYYAGLGAAVVAGAATGLAWALPAAAAGGAEYRAAILWGQTAGRVAEAFAHQRPVWWYLPVLPALLFPWIVWPPAWRSVFRSVRSADAGVRLALAWLGGALLLLSLISGKQPHYLLPLFPALALLTAAGLGEVRIRRWSAALPALVVVAGGATLAGVAYWLRATPDATATLDVPEWWRNITPYAGLSILGVGVVVALARVRTPHQAVVALALQSAAVVVMIHLFAVRPIALAYDVGDFAAYVHGLQREGRSVAMLGEYHGQFAFLGRLERPIDVIDANAAGPWLEGDPRRRLIVVLPTIPPDGMRAELAQVYRGRALALVDDDAWNAMQVDKASGVAPDPAAPAAISPRADRPE